jgi:hypothetical protein
MCSIRVDCSKHISTIEVKNEKEITRMVNPKDRKSIMSQKEAFERRNSRKLKLGEGVTMSKSMRAAMNEAINSAYEDREVNTVATEAAGEDTTAWQRPVYMDTVATEAAGEHITAWQRPMYMNTTFIWQPIQWMSYGATEDLWEDYPTMTY